MKRHMKRRHFIQTGGALLGVTWAGTGTGQTISTPLLAATPLSTHHEMAERVLAFLDSLNQEQQMQATFSFNSEERFNWHYTPRSRQGISLKALNTNQQQQLGQLLEFSLSEIGYQKVQSIITLETVLQQLGGSPSFRDPELYYLTVFGSPPQFPWGWRFEGHHLSLNITVLTPESLAVTPAFWGANPANVTISPHQGLRALAQEQDLAFELLRSLSPLQSEQIYLSDQSFGDILTGPGRADSLNQPMGLLLGDMSLESRERAIRLINTYLQNMRQDWADYYSQKIQDASLDQIRFSWAGGIEPGQAHYYRLHGPTVLIEYDNTQNNANHIHAIWRDLQQDFGGDVLGLHYEHPIHAHHFK